MNPFDFFDSIFCINLDRRKDRWEESKREFESVGILDRVLRFSAIEHENSCFGNHLSHARILELANLRGYTNVLIFEDDVNFFPNALENLTKSLNDVPSNWDMIYLGANLDCYPAYKFTTNLARITGAFSTHAYGINFNLFHSLIKINRDFSTIHNDVAYAHKIHPNYNCFLTVPLVAGQRDSYSDIQKKVMSSNDMFQSRLRSNLVE